MHYQGTEVPGQPEASSLAEMQTTVAPKERCEALARLALVGEEINFLLDQLAELRAMRLRQLVDAPVK